MVSKHTREYLRNTNTALVQQFAVRRGLEVQGLNRGYQLRVDGVLDIYPVNQRYHIIKTGERGEWKTENDLGELYRKASEHRLINYISTARDKPLPTASIIDDIITRDKQRQPKRWWEFWRAR